MECRNDGITEKKIKITFLSWLPETKQGENNLVDLIGRFEKKNPAIQIEVIPTVYQETKDLLLKLITNGNAPDVAQIVSHWTSFFASMGAFSPAMGLIGTLIGLVHMLQSMQDPSSIGPAMAMALITTFYGALLANVLFLPISGKLKTRSEEELFVKELMMEGVMAVTKGDNPRIVEQKLHAFRAPRFRQSAYKD